MFRCREQQALNILMIHACLGRTSCILITRNQVYKGALNAFVQLIVWLNLIFHWVADLFIVGNVQHKMYGWHPDESRESGFLVTKQHVLPAPYCCRILSIPHLCFFYTDELHCSPVSMYVYVHESLCVCVGGGNSQALSSSFMLLFIDIEQYTPTINNYARVNTQ